MISVAGWCCITLSAIVIALYSSIAWPLVRGRARWFRDSSVAGGDYPDPDRPAWYVSVVLLIGIGVGVHVPGTVAAIPPLPGAVKVVVYFCLVLASAMTAVLASAPWWAPRSIRWLLVTCVVGAILMGAIRGGLV